MKILHLNTTDIRGGAGRAVYRIHQSLRNTGVSSKLLCQNKTSDDKDVIGPEKAVSKGLAVFRGFLDRSLVSIYPKKQRTLFYPQWLPDTILPFIRRTSPDIVHLHWICGGFVKIETIGKINRPIVWTLHDMWGFTGGCHISAHCENYTRCCGRCPQLGSGSDYDVSRWVWRRKKKAFKKSDITVVTPSRWLENRTRKSNLMRGMRTEVIPNCLDLNKYHPIDKRVARGLLRLPKEKTLILFSELGFETDLKGGRRLLHAALEKLSQCSGLPDIEMVALGSSEPEIPPLCRFKIHYMGWLSDDISLALVYSACDCFVHPSRADNLPNMVMESMACGTPCIAFNLGGVPEMIAHKKNGYLARSFDVVDFAQGVLWILADKERLKTLSQKARKTVEIHFDPVHIAETYKHLYGEILKRR